MDTIPERCPTDAELAELLADGDAAKSVRARWLPHMDQCQGCRELLAEVLRVDASAEPADDSRASRPRLGRFEVGEILGEGAMGVVYSGRDTTLRRRVAVKILRPQVELEGLDPEQLIREARAMARLAHPNVATVYEAGMANGRVFIAMEFLGGGTLREWCTQPRDWRSVVRLYAQAGSGLAAAHDAGLIHRDFKPDNVLLGADGRPRVTDFGLAGGVVEPPTVIPGVPRPATGSDAPAGTPIYMAPEQFECDGASPKSDQFSFAVALYESLYGRRPFSGNSIEAIRRALLEDAPAPAPEDTPVPPRVFEILLKAMARDPAARYPSLNALLEALLAVLGERLDRTEPGPFVGLSPFREGDASLYFGRARELEQARDELRSKGFLAVVGPSGVGKSSFVRAGLLPELRASGGHTFVQARPGRDPFGNIARALAEHGPASSADTHRRATRSLTAAPDRLLAALRHLARSRGTTVIVFIDQLEELYTLGVDLDTRRGFAAALTHVARGADSQVRLILSIRSDLLDRAAEDHEFVRVLSKSLLFMPLPDRQTLREALTLPVSSSGFEFESALLVEEILDALDGRTGALPLLQFAGERLWVHRDVESRTITRDSYDRIGTIHGALAEHADSVVAALSPKQQGLARRVFQRLVTSDRTKDLVPRTELISLMGDDASLGDETLTELVRARLLVIGELDGEPAVELVHEALIEGWPTLQRWLEQDREALAFIGEVRSAAKQWDNRGRPQGLLWTGDALADARLRMRTVSQPLPSREQAFLTEALRLATRRARIRRFAVIGVIATLVAVIAGGAIALWAIRRAEQQAQRESQQKIMEAQRAREAEGRLAGKVRDLERAEGELKQSNQRLKTTLAEAEEQRRRAEETTEALRQAIDERTVAERTAITAAAERRRAQREASRANARAAEADARKKALGKDLDPTLR